MNNILRYILLNIAMFFIILNRGLLFFSVSTFRKILLFVLLITYVSFLGVKISIIAILVLFIIGLRITYSKRFQGDSYHSTFEIEKILDFVVKKKNGTIALGKKANIRFVHLVLPLGEDVLKIDMRSDFNGFTKALFYGVSEYVIYYTNELVGKEEYEQKEIISDIVDFLSSPKGLLIFILESFERTYSHFFFLIPISFFAKLFKERLINEGSE